MTDKCALLPKKPLCLKSSHLTLKIKRGRKACCKLLASEQPVVEGSFWSRTLGHGCVLTQRHVTLNIKMWGAVSCSTGWPAAAPLGRLVFRHTLLFGPRCSLTQSLQIKSSFPVTHMFRMRSGSNFYLSWKTTQLLQASDSCLTKMSYCSMLSLCMRPVCFLKLQLGLWLTACNWWLLPVHQAESLALPSPVPVSPLDLFASFSGGICFILSMSFEEKVPNILILFLDCQEQGQGDSLGRRQFPPGGLTTKSHQNLLFRFLNFCSLCLFLPGEPRAWQT